MATILEVDHRNQQYCVKLPGQSDGRFTVDDRLQPALTSTPPAMAAFNDTDQSQGSPGVVATTAGQVPANTNNCAEPPGVRTSSSVPTEGLYQQLSKAQLTVNNDCVQRLTLPHTAPGSTEALRKLDDEVINIGADLIMRDNINRCSVKQHAKMYIFSSHWLPKLLGW
jgi:hypothetical protein